VGTGMRKVWKGITQQALLMGIIFWMIIGFSGAYSMQKAEIAALSAQGFSVHVTTRDAIESDEPFYCLAMYLHNDIRVCAFLFRYLSLNEAEFRYILTDPVTPMGIWSDGTPNEHYSIAGDKQLDFTFFEAAVILPDLDVIIKVYGFWSPSGLDEITAEVPQLITDYENEFQSVSLMEPSQSSTSSTTTPEEKFPLQDVLIIGGGIVGVGVIAAIIIGRRRR
jgi:hypothetical protein